MAENISKYGTVVALLAVFVASLMFSWLTVQVGFPIFEYRSTEGIQLVPSEPYNDIAGSVSRFLWEYRALDLTAQAFVIVAAVICCLAMLKTDTEVS